ncbi:hypothetical protein D9756_009956 [Leucocoprinus leucothites]|uniref:DUF6534 domain-containing protein n=1 Tax=Leucocoprinus leucothites TaxID=201217 RepID=A0A8H5CU07_9AGAR|nr:hypothetical protein D9756_009956 [Leucoagaricus leucothites]
MAPMTLLSLENAALYNTVGGLFLRSAGYNVISYPIASNHRDLRGINDRILTLVMMYGVVSSGSLRCKRSGNTTCFQRIQLHKYSVAALWILSTLHLTLTIHAVYTYIITGFGDRVGLEYIVWSIKLQVSANVRILAGHMLFTGADSGLVVVKVLIILIVHSLYPLRVWILGEYHRGIVGYLVALVLMGSFVIGIVFAYHMYEHMKFRTSLALMALFQLFRYEWVIVAAFATSTGFDSVIAAAMYYYLWKSQAPTSRLNTRISTVIQYSLGSGLFTSACSLSALFIYVLLPNTFIFLALEFLLTKHKQYLS